MTSLKLRFLVTFAIWLCWHLGTAAAQSNGCDGAGNCYVRAAASGSNNGTDWNNAYAALPAGLTRGVTYYVAAGNYPAHTFNDADSGTTLITVQAPTIASHGTATGWSSSYVGQATFTAPLLFYTDYYTFDGVYRTNTGAFWTDWKNSSGYGFAVNNESSPGVAYDSQAAVKFGNADQGSGVAASHITFEYVDINGSHSANSDLSCDWGIWSSGVISGTQDTDNYVGYVHIHNTGGNELNVDGNNGFTAEYSWFELMNHENTSGQSHSETIDFRGNGTNPDTNIIFRYNFVEGGGGTAFATGGTNGAGAASNWYIYGNTFFDNSAEETSPLPASGNGIFTTGYGYASFTNLYFVNNTISSINPAGSCSISPDTSASYANYVVENNLWYNCPQYGSPASNATTWDYNAYYNAPTMCSNDTTPHASCSTTNPFVNVAQTPGADNFDLTADTTAGASLSSSLPQGCTTGVNCLNVDMSGNIRGADGTWDRGALQFSNAGPAPPTGLAAVVN